jgi:hypothetical protein
MSVKSYGEGGRRRNRDRESSLISERHPRKRWSTVDLRCWDYGDNPPNFLCAPSPLTTQRGTPERGAGLSLTSIPFLGTPPRGSTIVT